MSETARLPYPGLRPFRRDETDLFFGREPCVDEMVGRLAATRFLAVLGPSGSGKSSLVRTGLLDALELGLMAGAGPRWAIADLRPAGRPIENLAHALLSLKPGAEIAEFDIASLSAMLRRGPRSVVQWCRDGNLPERTNLLILVDQFEELFRYADYAGREEAERFVALLIESATAEHLPIYVALTMRSEFLGPCALFPDLVERINAGLYLVRRMTREEVREAIEGPAAVCGFTLEPALVNRLLNDLASFAPWEDERGVDQLQLLARRADQLPLLQHVLNRLWLDARGAGEAGPITLRLATYEALGGLTGALNRHADQVLASIGSEQEAIAGLVLRALVSGSTIATAVRRPCPFGELVTLAGGDKAAVERVVEAFRSPHCNFLVTSHEGPLTDETVIDISHESLIRQWEKLREWAQAEAKEAEEYRDLERTAIRWQEGHAGLLGKRESDAALSWWNREKPSEAWARRYGGNFALAARFLDQSGRRQRTRRRASRAASYAAILAIVAGGTFIVHQQIQLGEFREARSFYNTGDLYDTGRGVPQSNEKAIASFQKALALGDPDAARRIAEIRLREDNYQQALASYRDYVARVQANPGADPEDLDSRKALRQAAGRIGNISYDLVMNGEFMPGLEGATFAAHLAPNLLWIQITRADALMMLGNIGAARAIYLRYQGLPDDGENMAWNDDVLDDFDTLAGKKFVKPMTGQSKALMKEIRARFSAGPEPVNAASAKPPGAKSP